MSLCISDARELSYSDFLARYAIWENKRQECLSKDDLERQRLVFLQDPDCVTYENARADCLMKHVEDSIRELNRLDVVAGFNVERVRQRQALGEFLADIISYKEAANLYAWSLSRFVYPGYARPWSQIREAGDAEGQAITRLRFLQHV